MQKCKDWQGLDILEGHRFRPSRDDMCMECVCTGGMKAQCRTASCALPPCHPYEIVPDACCEFTCLSDEGGSSSGFRNSTVFFMNDTMSTAGVRLVASTLTCVMVLLLIVFFMHKLRRHRRFLMNVPQALQRRRQDIPNQCDSDAGGCTTSQPSAGFNVHYRHLRDDPPPPYVAPKEQQSLVYSSGSNCAYAVPSYSEQGPSCLAYGPSHRPWDLTSTVTCQCQNCPSAPVTGHTVALGQPHCPAHVIVGYCSRACPASATATPAPAAVHCGMPGAAASSVEPAGAVSHFCRQCTCCTRQPLSSVPVSVTAAPVTATELDVAGGGRSLDHELTVQCTAASLTPDEAPGSRLSSPVQTASTAGGLAQCACNSGHCCQTVAVLGTTVAATVLPPPAYTSLDRPALTATAGFCNDHLVDTDRHRLLREESREDGGS